MIDDHKNTNPVADYKRKKGLVHSGKSMLFRL